MDPDTRRQKRRDNVLSSLNVAIGALKLAKEVPGIAPAQAVFSSVTIILSMIRDSNINEEDYVDLGLACASVCAALDRGLSGKLLSELNGSVCEAVNQLTTTVAGIERKIIEQSGRNAVSRAFHAKKDKETIVAWRLELNRILHVFDTELAINTHIAVSDVHHDVVNTKTVISDVHRDVMNTRAIVSELHQNFTGANAILCDIRTMVKNQEESGGRKLLAHTRPAISTDNGARFLTSIPGESPPRPPRACFGRDELVDQIVCLAEILTPLALIGVGGIGKTSIALTALHSDRIKQRFGDDRWFIRCDQFPPSLSHFLDRLSTAIGAGVENPKDLTPLQPFLSSKEMLIVLDNAESVLDPQETDAQEIYSVMEELSRFDNICLCITSRISIIPPNCETLDIPTLSMDAACNTFYRIYKSGGRPDLVNNILHQLDFHPLSITLLATVAYQNKWDVSRLAGEWENRRTAMLQTHHNKSLAATIELSLASPMFQELGPDARALLEVVAFFPKGVDENNLDWLFPTISNGKDVLDKFCVLSLTYRSNGHTTMLAPLRDHFRPKDPMSSPLLCATKEHYFSRLSVETHPDKPGFEETRWITSEDANVEHLLDVFTSIDANSNAVWNACAQFMDHLYWCKPRLVILGPKINGLSDGHPSKPRCLFGLSYLFYAVGNYAESKRLGISALELYREWKNEGQVAGALMLLARANRSLYLYKDGIPQAIEASEIYERLNDTAGQGYSLQYLAQLLAKDNQVDAAEEAASRAINLFPDGARQPQICEYHYTLGYVYSSRGEAGAAIAHLNAALRISVSLNLQEKQASILRRLVELLLKEGRLDDALVHLERLKSDAVYNLLSLGLAAVVQVCAWRREGRFEEAESEVLRVIGVYEKAGAPADFLEFSKRYLREVEEKMNNPAASD